MECAPDYSFILYTSARDACAEEFHHPNLTSPSWMKPQTKAPNSLQHPKGLIRHLAMKHQSLYWPFSHNIPSVSLLLKLKGLAKHETSPAAVALITGRNNATIWEHKKKNYFWMRQIGLWADVSHNNDDMSLKKCSWIVSKCLIKSTFLLPNLWFREKKNFDTNHFWYQPLLRDRVSLRQRTQICFWLKKRNILVIASQPNLSCCNAG